MDNKGNPHDLWEDCVGVSPSALFAEGISMVGGQNDDALVIEPSRLEELNEFAEATSDLYVAALIELGLVLLILGIVLNVVARALVLGVQRRRYQEAGK